MARTTNSDTLPYVESRYELGMLASQRVRDLNGGAEPVVDKNNDKSPVANWMCKMSVTNLFNRTRKHRFLKPVKNRWRLAPKIQCCAKSMQNWKIHWLMKRPIQAKMLPTMLRLIRQMPNNSIH